MTAERDALADEQAYGIAAKVMAGWPVPTISMYAALVRAGYRAALAAPAQGEPTRHLTSDEQQMLGRALRASAREVTAQGEPQDYGALIGRLRDRATLYPPTQFNEDMREAANAITALRAELARLADTVKSCSAAHAYEHERAERDALAEAIRRAINTNSAENASNTPDYILAQFMCACLVAFDTATQQRETWYGRDARPSSAALAAPPAPSVPREPTKAMLNAAFPINNCDSQNLNVWRAMYDTASNDQPGGTSENASLHAQPDHAGTASPPDPPAATAQGEPQPEDDFVIPCAIDGCKQPSQMPASEYCSLHSAIGTSPTGGEFAPQPAAAPAQGEPQDCDALIERLRDVLRNWTNVTDEEQSVIRDAADAIAALRAEHICTRFVNDEHGMVRCHECHSPAVLPRAEAECADLRRRLDEHIDDKERALRLSAKESNHLTTEIKRLRKECDALRSDALQWNEHRCGDNE